MKAIPLKRLLNKREIAALLGHWGNLSTLPLALGVAGEDGEWLCTFPCPPADQVLVQQVCQTAVPVHDERVAILPLVVEDHLYGVLYSSPGLPLSDVLRQTLLVLIQKELAQKSLAQETLDRYREINLLYRVHETIGASLDLDEVIHRVLEESIRIIKADGGSVLLHDELTDRLIAHENAGLDVASAENNLIGQALSDKVWQVGKPRILNDMYNFVRPDEATGVQLGALLSAPFKSEERSLGVITLARIYKGTMFTAGDEKLLMALASQAGIAIANAQQVQAREKQLKQQIQALKIEIDEAKKQKELAYITESEYFKQLQETAQRMRAEFDV